MKTPNRFNRLEQDAAQAELDKALEYRPRSTPIRLVRGWRGWEMSVQVDNIPVLRREAALKAVAAAQAAHKVEVANQRAMGWENGRKTR